MKAFLSLLAVVLVNHSFAADFCVPDGNLYKPNYSNAIVKNAYDKLLQVDDDDFYLYDSSIGKQYQGKNIQDRFLKMLCSEYSDNQKMLEAKLKWFGRIVVIEKNRKPESSGLTPLERMSITDYFDLVKYSREFDNHQKSIPGMFERYWNICTVNGLLNLYIFQGKKVTSWKDTYRELNKYCFTNSTPEELNSIQWIRGDAAIHPLIGESNAMILRAKENQNICDVQNSNCELYRKSPFTKRYEAAQKALWAWSFIPTNLKNIFNDTSKEIMVIGNQDDFNSPFGIAGKNFSNKFYNKKLSIDGFINSPITKLNLSVDDTYKYLTSIVNRHSDCNKSGYSSKFASTSYCYSPFLSTSYEFHSADEFATSKNDLKKHFMFVFKHRNDPNDQTIIDTVGILNGVDTPEMRKMLVDHLNWKRSWVDVESFGTTANAKREREVIKLGTPNEQNFETILYLKNISNK